jgi:voltage-gated potassium channel
MPRARGWAEAVIETIRQARTIGRAAALLAIVFLTGVAGYRFFAAPDQGWVQALYMTVITLTTVGYGETVDVSAHPAAMLFTSALLLIGVSTFVFFFSNVTAFVVEGGLDRLLWRRKMDRHLAGLEGHVILCGAGNTGRHIARELLETGRPFVVVDESDDELQALHAELGSDFPSVQGDATDDDVLRRAAVDQAQGLIAVTSDDKNNLIVTVSARLLNPKLRIVSRCVDRRVEDKIRKAGADAVVSPDLIGGLRIVSEMVRPTVVSFLDVMLRDKEKGLRIESVPVEAGSSVAGISVEQLRARDIGNALVVALARSRDDWEYNPPGDRTIEAGMEIVIMSNPDARQRLAALAGA